VGIRSFLHIILSVEQNRLENKNIYYTQPKNIKKKYLNDNNCFTKHLKMYWKH